jgi:hypothetical protein
MWARHRVSVAEAREALADADALLFDPDPKSRSGNSARLPGHAPTAVGVLVVILVHRSQTGPAVGGARTLGGPTALIDARKGRRVSHEHGREAAC